MVILSQLVSTGLSFGIDMACRFPGYYLPLREDYTFYYSKIRAEGLKKVKGQDYLVAFDPEKVASLKAFDEAHCGGVGSEIPCDRCFGCRLNARKEWTYRLVNESEMYDPSKVWFLTLTYDSSELTYGYSTDIDPRTGELLIFNRPSINYSDYDAFRMRLSKRYEYDHKHEKGYIPVRQYHCGEYGEKFQRPHFHAIVFGPQLADLARDSRPFGKNGLRISDDLSKLWGKGYAVLEPACYETMEYTAGYVLKKSIGLDKSEKIERFYAAFDLPPVYEDFRGKSRLAMPDTMISFEKASGSNRPGIGRSWYDAHKDEVYRTDEMTIMRKGRALHVKPPAYYDRLFDADQPWSIPIIKMKRVAKAEARKTALLEEQHLTEEAYASLQLELDELKFKKIRRIAGNF